jgi:DNA polymerase III subunit delta
MVAVKADKADAFLAAPPVGIRLFLIYGSDQGAITERARRLEQLALKRGGGDAAIRIGSDELSADPGRVADEAFSASLFGGEPVIALRMLDGRHNVIGAVAPLLDRPPESAWLIVEAGDLGKTSPLRKGFEESKSAAALPTYALEGAKLTAFIFAAAEEAGVEIDPAALELLSESLAGDRLASRGELEKLFLYVQDTRRVTLADAEAIVGETTEAQTDHVIDSALIGDSEGLETGLNRLRAESASFAGLGALTLRHLINLQALRATLDAGGSASRAIEYARPPIHFRRRARVEATLNRWPADALSDARRRVDRAILLTRKQPALEAAALSETLHQLALTARRLKGKSA